MCDELIQARAKRDLKRAMAATGVDPGRSARYLSGDLDGIQQDDDDMSDDRIDTPVRVPHALIERAEALLPALTEHPELFGWRKPKKTAVIRLALVRGLEALELEHSGDGGKS